MKRSRFGEKGTIGILKDPNPGCNGSIGSVRWLSAVGRAVATRGLGQPHPTAAVSADELILCSA